MPKRVHLVVVVASALAFALDTSALAQIAAPTPTAQEVRGIAPQLVAFAGSEANFQNLVNGLNQGAAVTLVTLTADGFTQTVTFTPASAMTVAEVARTLEIARQQLIVRGIASPTAEQIGVTLVGGLLPTAAGSVQVTGLVAAVTPGGLQPGASAGASVRPPVTFGSANPPGNLVVDIRPVARQAPATSASPGTTTSASPGTTTSASPGTTTSASPQTATTPSTSSTTGASGALSPQMQGRR